MRCVKQLCEVKRKGPGAVGTDYSRLRLSGRGYIPSEGKKSALLFLVSMVLACLGSFALSGCGASYVVNGLKTGSLFPQPNSVSFGAVSVGQTAQANISLINQGAAPIEISELNLTGQSFSVDGPGGLPVTIAGSGSYILNVHFNPVAPGTATGLLIVKSNSVVSPTASISLNGVGTASASAPAPSELSLSCSSTSIAGSGSDSCTVTLNASAPTGGLSVNLASNDAAVVVPPILTVPANASSALFTASVSSVSTVQRATLTAGAGNLSSSFALQLNPASAKLSLSSNSLVFGNVAVNATATQSVTLTSTGIASVTINSAALTGAGFRMSGLNLPVTLNPGQTATLSAEFDPASAGTATGQLTLTSNSSPGSATAINLSGTGVPMLTALTCSSKSITGTGMDACSVVLNAAAPSGGFTVSLLSGNTAVTVPATLTIPAGATSAEFTASVTSVSTAQAVTLTASAAGTSEAFALQLNAALPSLSFSTNALSFGNVTVNSAATPQPVTLTSTGTVPVTMTGATLMGTGFSMSGVTFPKTLSPGEVVTLNVDFDPTAVRPATGQLTISSNSSTGSSSMISLSGSGTAVPAALSTLSCSSGAITGSGTDACKVTLTTSAPGGGLTVNLASSNSAVTVPSTLTVPAGAASAGFTATVSSVMTAQAVTMTASTGTVMKNFTLQLNAAILALSINATSVTFGDVVINTPATQSVTLTSTGTMPVTVSGAAVTGAGFAIPGAAFSATLNPGQEAMLNIEFDPTTVGSVMGQLTITSNASTNSAGVISLSGAGMTAQAVAVAVSPAAVSVTLGATQQFAASVTGTSNTAVTWAVSGTGCSGTACGTISLTGLYTAPAMEPSSATVAITATSQSDPAKSSTANASIVPPQADGYKLAWQDTFSTLNLCSGSAGRCNWYYPGLWNFGPYGLVSEQDHTFVDLNWVNSQIYSTNISTCAANGLNCHSWTFGYFEVSMAFDPVLGNWPTLWLMPVNYNLNSIQTGPELDIFEWQSNTAAVGYGTVHTWVKGSETGDNVGSNSWPIPGGTNLAHYHTYGILWTPTTLSWYFDNSLLETFSTTSAPFNEQLAGQYAMFLVLSLQAGCNWTVYHDTPCAGQASPLDMQVQWVHIYAPPE